MLRLRAWRDEERRRVCWPAPTPEEPRAATVTVERFMRSLKGDDGAKPFA